MKVFLSIILLLLPLVPAAAMEVQLGDTLQTVRSALGAPRGQVKIGERHLLYYDRGEVELRSGAVARVELRSADEQAVFAAQRSATEQRVSAENARQVAEGTELKARKLSDTDFRATPPSYQVAFWESFAARYPGVVCNDQLIAARLQLAEQQEVQYPTVAPQEVILDEPAYVSSDSAPYLNRYGYGRSNFALSPGRRFANPLLPLHSRPAGQFSPALGGSNHHASLQLTFVGTTGVGTRIRR